MLGAFAAHWFPTMVATLVALFAAWLHLGIALKFLITLPFIALACQTLIDLANKRGVVPDSLNTPSQAIQDMQVELVEHGEFSSELLLECVNHGGPSILTARLRVIGASSNLAYKRAGYEGRWAKPVSIAHNRVGVEYGWKPKAHVASGASANLRVAIIDAPQKPEGNAYMYLYGTDEHATWNLEHTPTEQLPYFIVEIVIRSEGRNGSVKRTYKVGPPLRCESLRMTEYRV